MNNCENHYTKILKCTRFNRKNIEELKVILESTFKIKEVYIRDDFGRISLENGIAISVYDTGTIMLQGLTYYEFIFNNIIYLIESRQFKKKKG